MKKLKDTLLALCWVGLAGCGIFKPDPDPEEIFISPQELFGGRIVIEEREAQLTANAVIAWGIGDKNKTRFNFFIPEGSWDVYVSVQNWPKNPHAIPDGTYPAIGLQAFNLLLNPVEVKYTVPQEIIFGPVQGGDWSLYYDNDTTFSFGDPDSPHDDGDLNVGIFGIRLVKK